MVCGEGDPVPGKCLSFCTVYKYDCKSLFDVHKVGPNQWDSEQGRRNLEWYITCFKRAPTKPDIVKSGRTTKTLNQILWKIKI